VIDGSCPRVDGLAAGSFLPPLGRGRAAGVHMSPRSARGEWLGRGYGRDDIVNGGAGCGEVGFIVDERFMGGGLGDTVDTVG
jgi:hypothetical protein